VLEGALHLAVPLDQPASPLRERDDAVPGGDAGLLDRVHAGWGAHTTPLKGAEELPVEDEAILSAPAEEVHE